MKYAGVDLARRDDVTYIVVTGDKVPVEIYGIEMVMADNARNTVLSVCDVLQKYDVNYAIIDVAGTCDPMIEMIRSEVWGRGLGIAVDGFVATQKSSEEIFNKLRTCIGNNRIIIPPHLQSLERVRFAAALAVNKLM